MHRARGPRPPQTWLLSWSLIASLAACAGGAAEAPPASTAEAGGSGGKSAPGAGGRGGAPAPAGSDAASTADHPGAGQDAPAPAEVDAAAPADAPPAPVAGLRITVAAGAQARENTIVTFDLPGPTAGAYRLRGGDGKTLPLQVDATGHAAFVLPALAANAEASFALEPDSPGAAEATVKAGREADGVALTIDGHKVFRYQTQGKLPGGVGTAYLRGGYVHPLYTPAGALVTDDYPGDHRHHHGIWSAWAHTKFEGDDIDFWNMGGRTAKVDFDALVSTWDGPVHGGLEARHLFTDLLAKPPKTALTERWTLTVYRTHADPPPYFVFDLVSVQEATSGVPVMLQNYIYGGFSLRGAAGWGGGGGAQFLTSEGKTRGNGDGSDARWCYIGGNVGGKVAGYTGLGHPGNFRAPQPVRINPTDPFFSFAPVRDGGFPIEPGKPYVSRFRIVVTDGAPDKALLDRLWNDYATPPVVTVTR